MPIFRKKCMCLRAPKEEIDILDYSHCSLTDIPSDVFLHERTLVELLVDNNRIHDLPRVSSYNYSKFSEQRIKLYSIVALSVPIQAYTEESNCIVTLSNFTLP